MAAEQRPHQMLAYATHTSNDLDDKNFPVFMVMKGVAEKALFATGLPLCALFASIPILPTQAGIGWCPKMYADKRRANKKQRRHGIFEVWKLKIPFAVPVAVGRI